MMYISCWNVPYISLLEISSHYYFENVVLGGPNSFFQLDCQVDISVYMLKATKLYHSRKLVGLKPS
jgi:hypothetical protein